MTAARKTPNVFNHGQLRLYLLQLIAEQPVTGYDIIRLLENRFLGLYTPSTGTVYPRLHRLESDGLIERRKVGSRSIYSILPTGQDELARRNDEIVTLSREIDQRQEQLATEVRSQVYDRADQTRLQLDTAAAELRRSQRHGIGEEVRGALDDARENLRQIVRRRRLPRGATSRDVERAGELAVRLADFADAVLLAAQEADPTPDRLDEVDVVLSEASATIVRIFGAD